MLVLTRRSGEKLRIGADIVVTVLDNSSRQIKIGIEAPHDIPIYREEVYKRIQEKNKSSVVTEIFPSQMFERFLKGKK